MSNVRHVLVDFSSIRRGGGVQLSLNFLNRYHETDFSHFKISVLLPGDGELATFRPETDFNGFIHHAPINLCHRLWFSHGKLQKLIHDQQVNAIFTFFGPGIPHPAHVPSLVSIAYPIICYPDSPFWHQQPIFKTLSTRLKIFGICRRLRQGTCLLAETEVMRNRLAKQLGSSEDKFHVIPPAVSDFIDNSPGKPEEPCHRFLILSGLAIHKNLWRLYDVAVLGHRNEMNFTFVMATTREAWLKTIRTSFPIDSIIINQHFDFHGAVPSNQIGDLYRSSDALISLSDLESFSNNYMESWKSGLPMICSDRDFSRHICGDSAIYVEPHQPESVVQGMKQLIENRPLRIDMVRHGKEKLSSLPSLAERYNRIAGLLRLMLEER